MIASSHARRIRRPRTHSATRSRSAAAFLLALACWATIGCSQGFFRQPLAESLPRADASTIAREHAPSALREDLDFLVALHERTCPDPYLRVSREAIGELASRLKDSIDRPMTRERFLPIVMELQAGYGVDHIIQNVPAEDLDAALARGDRLLPFRAQPDGDALAVVAVSPSEGGIEPGDRILAIGADSAALHIDRLRRLVPAESTRFRDARIRSSFRALSWAAGIRPPVDITIERADGTRHVHTVAGVGAEARHQERTKSSTRADAPEVAAAAGGEAAPTRELLVERAPFRCELLGSPPIALIDFPTMDGALAARWHEFLDDAIAAANARGCVGLIVDIRRNGGGDSALGDALLARITDRPYRLAGGMIWRKSDEGYDMIRLSVKPIWRWLLPLALPSVMPEYARLKPGEDLVVEAPVVARPLESADRAHRFVGPTCLLIGEGTFSSAMMLADGVRTYDLMCTIGEPTGGVPTSLGELGFVHLPHSKLLVQFCQKKFLRASGDPNDRGPVVPHITVAATPVGDAALSRAILEIQGQATLHTDAPKAHDQ